MSINKIYNSININITLPSYDNEHIINPSRIKTERETVRSIVNKISNDLLNSKIDVDLTNFPSYKDVFHKNDNGITNEHNISCGKRFYSLTNSIDLLHIDPLKFSEFNIKKDDEVHSFINKNLHKLVSSIDLASIENNKYKQRFDFTFKKIDEKSLSLKKNDDKLSVSQPILNVNHQLNLHNSVQSKPQLQLNKKVSTDSEEFSLFDNIDSLNDINRDLNKQGKNNKEFDFGISDLNKINYNDINKHSNNVHLINFFREIVNDLTLSESSCLHYLQFMIVNDDYDSSAFMFFKDKYKSTNLTINYSLSNNSIKSAMFEFTQSPDDLLMKVYELDQSYLELEKIPSLYLSNGRLIDLSTKSFRYIGCLNLINNSTITVK